MPEATKSFYRVHPSGGGDPIDYPSARYASTIETPQGAVLRLDDDEGQNVATFAEGAWITVEQVRRGKRLHVEAEHGPELLIFNDDRMPDTPPRFEGTLIGDWTKRGNEEWRRAGEAEDPAGQSHHLDRAGVYYRRALGALYHHLS